MEALRLLSLVWLSALVGETVAGNATWAQPAVVQATAIHPDLNPKSSKKFFGKDYPDDESPKVMHEFDYPYPAVQGSNTFDKDYVQDENNDRGEWEAQMEYDRLRSKLARQKKMVEKAKQKKEEQEEKAETPAKKTEDNESQSEDKKTPEASEDNRKEDKSTDEKEHDDHKSLKDEVDAANKTVRKEVTDLKDCESELEEAKAALEALRAKLEAAKKEQQTAKSNAEASEAELKSAQEKEEELEKKVAETGKLHTSALDDLRSKEAELARLEKELAEAEKVLRSIRNGDSAGTVSSSASSEPSSTETAHHEKSNARAANTFPAFVAAAVVFASMLHSV